MFSNTNIQLLSQQDWCYTVAASHTIYYKSYPYRVSINSNYPRSKRGLYRKPKRSEVFSHSAEIFSALENISNESAHRLDIGYRHGLSHIYLSDITDVKLITSVFADRVVTISGPVSSEHLELLQSGNIKCVPKKRLWDNKYNCKVESWITWRDRHTAKSSDLIDFLRTSIELRVVSANNSDSRATFYCDFDEFVQIQPFIKLSNLGCHNLTVYKCITE